MRKRSRSQRSAKCLFLAKDNLRTTVDLPGLASGISTLKVRNGQEFTQQQLSIVK